MILSSSCDNNVETVKCDCDSTAESDRQEFLWELKPLNSPSTSDSVFYEESHFCSTIDDAPFKPCRSVHTIAENPAIEIRDESTISVDLPPISWHGYNSIPKFLNICNVGRNVLINGQWPNGKPYIQGGPLNGSYIFSQIHFHAPSEHEIDGKRFPLEMHVVHYKTNYLTQERAMEEKDGTIVLVYLFQVKDSCDTVLSMFTKQNSQLRAVSRQSEITGVPLNLIVKPFYSHYYIYWGSINTMKKSYLLQRIINCSNLYATEQEVYDIFHLMEGGNSTGRRVPLMKPLNNAVYYAGGYNIALKQEEIAIQCNNSYLTEASTISQSCQTFISAETNKKDIQVQAASDENYTSVFKHFKLCFEKFDPNDKNSVRGPHYVLEEDSEKKDEAKFEYKRKRSYTKIPTQCLDQCRTRTRINIIPQWRPSMESCYCECHSKSQKERGKKQKHKRKGSKHSMKISSQDLDECQSCRDLKCGTRNKDSRCKKNNQKRQKKKRKRKQEDSDSSVEISSQDFVECQTCKNLKCTTEITPSECEKNCVCHSVRQKSPKEKQKLKENGSNCSVRTSSQDFVECQTCKNLKCSIQSTPSECEKKCDCHFESRKYSLEKRKRRDSDFSAGTSSQDFEECQTCKNLKCSMQSTPSECEENCDCHIESRRKKKKKLKFNFGSSRTKRSKRTRKKSNESIGSEEDYRVKSQSKSKTRDKRKKRSDESVNSSGSKSSRGKPMLKSLFKPRSKSKVALSDNCAKNSKSKGKNCAKKASPTQPSSVNYVLTPFNLRKGPTIPRVLYKGENNKTEDSTKVCNFIVSENSPSAFASTYRLPQLKTTEPLKEFFLQTEHLFHTEKKGGFSMCTNQDYRVTIVYNQNVLQEFRGNFSPKDLELGTYEKLDLSPVYPEPHNVIVRLEDCYVKMETLNKLYIRAKFLLKQSFLNLSPSAKSELLKEAAAETEKLVILNSDPKMKFLDTKETYLSTFQEGDRPQSIDQFMTPKSSLNEKERQSNKFISEEKELKQEGYEIELLKKPPEELETSKSNIFDSDQPYEPKVKKEKSQRKFAEKCDRLTKAIITRSKKNLFFVNKNVEKDETRSKRETFRFNKGKTLSISNELFSTTKKGFGIKNAHFLPFHRRNLRSLNSEILLEQEDLEMQPSFEKKESINSEKKNSTVLLFYYDRKNSKTKSFQSSESKNLTLQHQETVTTLDIGSPENSNLKKPEVSSFKSKLKKPGFALNSQIGRKLKKTNLRVVPAPNSQKSGKKGLPSMIPISTKRKQQK